MNKVRDNKDKKIDINNKMLYSIILIIASLALIIFIGFKVNNLTKNKNQLSDIKKVKMVLPAKYDEIKCVDTECKYVVGIKGDGLSKTTYNVFDIKGKKIAKYKIDYSKKTSKLTDIVAVTKNYIVTRTINDKKYKYTLRDTKGRKKYSSDDKIDVVNNNLAVIKNGEFYKLIDKSGRILIDEINKYEEYAEGKFINIETKREKYIADENGNKLLVKYYISREIINEKLNTNFLIVKDLKNNLYNYFDIEKKKIIGESFESYDINEEITIYRTINKKVKKFVLKADGKQEKYDDNNDIYNKITKKIDLNKYYVYIYGIKDANQEYVVVNKKDDKSLGILNIKNNNYSKLFEYSKTTSGLDAVVSNINNNNNNSIVRITCDKTYCDTNKNIIYDLINNKKIYQEKKKDVIISDFAMYEDGYKIVKYSYSSDKYAGYSYVYNKNNKKVASSNYSIVIIDKNIVMGDIKNNDIVLYSAKENKKINNSDSLATKININDNLYFKFKKDNKTIVYKLNGNKVIEIPSSNYITYTNNYIVYLDNNKIKIYNTLKNKTKSYGLKKGEKLNDEFGDIISPYRGVIIINNTSSKNVKVVSSKGKIIKKIKKSEISTVKKNIDGNLLMFVKLKDKYALYVGN